MAPYNPPLGEAYAHVDVSGYDKRMILCLIGKGGKGFYDITRKLNLSYIWWDRQRNVIELWGNYNVYATSKMINILENFSRKFVPTTLEIAD